jgi:hypothetical protein
MAATSLLALLDDITALLDDISVMTKTAASKTAGVLGDDLAVNAEQVSDVNADRELPVIWAVAKGSMLNKVILVPIALLLSLFAPWLILPLLMLGGLYLCFEGAEKVFSSHHHKSSIEPTATVAETLDIASVEKAKIKGAIRTDFVLSIEIIVITLGTVAAETLQNKFIVLSLIAIAATVGVYGLVALIVKLDDMGLWLIRRQKQKNTRSIQTMLGQGLVNSAPYLMKTLTVVGTVAMFLVGGGIISHAIHPVAHFIEQLSLITTQWLESIAWLAATMEILTPIVANGIIGFIAGALLMKLVPAVQRIFSSN